MKLEIKEIDGAPVTGIPDGSRTACDSKHIMTTRRVFYSLHIFMSKYLPNIRHSSRIYLSQVAIGTSMKGF